MADAGRRVWPWVAGLGAVVFVGTGVAVGVAALDGGASDAPYCATLDAHARTDVRMIAFLEPELSADDDAIDRVEAILEGLGGVTDTEFIDQQDAYAEAQELFSDAPATAEVLREQDIPASFRFTVPDDDAADVADEALESDDAVVQVETPPTTGFTVLEVVEWVDERDVEGGLGRFGAWLDPDVAERLTDSAPDEVESDVDLLVEPLTAEEGTISDRHQRAAHAISRDATRRCDD